jgi:hypothetical protein
MTATFKACKYADINNKVCLYHISAAGCLVDPQTTPNTVLKANLGLKDVTHSVTGGSIKAQGMESPSLFKTQFDRC